MAEKFTVEDRGHETPCHIWQGAKNKDGYAVVKREGKTHLLHRLTWAEENGPIPAGQVMDHLCRIHACIRPEHLEPVTLKENLRRGEGHGGVLRTHCRRGHRLTGRNLYKRSDGTHRCRTCMLAANRAYRVRRKEKV